VTISNPSSNVFDFFKSYAVKTKVGLDPPYIRSDPEWQIKGSYVFRPVPFPYLRRAPKNVLMGIAELDYGIDKSIFFDTARRTISSSTGFDADIGDALDRGRTSCYGLGISWMDVPRNINAWSDDFNLDFRESAATFQKIAKKEVPFTTWWQERKQDVKVVSWIRGLDLGIGHDFKISMSVNNMSSIEVKAGGDTDLTLVKVKYFMWLESKVNVFSKDVTVTLTGNTHDERIDFGNDKFGAKPKFFWALTGFDVDSKHNLRLRSSVKELTKDHAILSISTWADTKINGVSFVCIACPDIIELF
jgi:hypothetical protein